MDNSDFPLGRENGTHAVSSHGGAASHKFFQKVACRTEQAFI